METPHRHTRNQIAEVQEAGNVSNIPVDFGDREPEISAVVGNVAVTASAVGCVQVSDVMACMPAVLVRFILPAVAARLRLFRGRSEAV